MASERTKLVGLYLGGQVLFLVLGVLPGLIFPPLFVYWLWRARQESE